MGRKKTKQPRVFVVQSQLLKDGLPKYDLTPAEEYGELVYLLGHGHKPWNTDDVLTSLRDTMHDFDEHDFLLPIGNPMFIGLASIVASEASPIVKFLLWSGREQRYLPGEANLDGEPE